MVNLEDFLGFHQGIRLFHNSFGMTLFGKAFNIRTFEIFIFTNYNFQASDQTLLFHGNNVAAHGFLDEN